MESLEGTVYIDDVDITQIGLDILRKNLTMIRQDPCPMEGSLKYNIDPFNKSKDGDIISILNKIGFEYTESDGHILTSENGVRRIEFISREKQLVCNALTILRKIKLW